VLFLPKHPFRIAEVRPPQAGEKYHHIKLVEQIPCAGPYLESDITSPICQLKPNALKIFKDATSERDVGGFFAEKWLTIYGREQSRYRTFSIVKIAPEKLYCSNADCSEKAFLTNLREKTSAAGVSGALIKNTMINTADLVVKNAGALGVATENAKLFSLAFDRVANEESGDVILSGYVNVADVGSCEK